MFSENATLVLLKRKYNFSIFLLFFSTSTKLFRISEMKSDITVFSPRHLIVVCLLFNIFFQKLPLHVVGQYFIRVFIFFSSIYESFLCINIISPLALFQGQIFLQSSFDFYFSYVQLAEFNVKIQQTYLFGNYGGTLICRIVFQIW